MRVSPLPTRHTVLQKGLGCWSLRVRVGERLAPSPSGLALQRRCQEASWDHVPSPHPCPANWPLKTLGDSHRVTRFRSREGSCAGGSESDPLPGVPGAACSSRAPAPKVFLDRRIPGAASQVLILSRSLPFRLFPPPSPYVLPTSLPFLPRCLPSLILFQPCFHPLLPFLVHPAWVQSPTLSVLLVSPLLAPSPQSPCSEPTTSPWVLQFGTSAEEGEARGQGHGRRS